MIIKSLPDVIDDDSPAYSKKIEFGSGNLVGTTYKPSCLLDLWKLVGYLWEMEGSIFFEIEREDPELKIQGYGDKNGFCLFQDTYNHEIKIIGMSHIDKNNLDLVQITDDRWGLTYFLPKKAFIDFAKLVEVGNMNLQRGKLQEYIPLSQTFNDLGLPDGYC